ncbi:hypothetical protein AB4Y64_11090 [Lysobacter sp. TAF61]|uniref:hypothetical protein n=1 Tax=Lysobacter sp. TAF61 TaxID=3233072 RepID=UPI003F95EC89
MYAWTRAVAVLCLLTSYANAKPPAAQASTGDSRIRVFGQNGANADLHPASACLKRDGRVRVSGTLGSAFGSLIGTVSNVSLGIPETVNTRNLSQMNGIASKAYFREYAIPSGVATSLRLGFQDVSNFYTAGGVTYTQVSPSCSGSISFTPQSGQDYEVGFSWQGRTCQLSVNHVIDEGGEVRLEPVTVVPAPKC